MSECFQIQPGKRAKKKKRNGEGERRSDFDVEEGLEEVRDSRERERKIHTHREREKDRLEASLNKKKKK